MSGNDNIKMLWIAYLAVLDSEGYSIYDMAYYPSPVYDNIMSVYVFLITFYYSYVITRLGFRGIFSKYGAVTP